jgi:hypothetical protein
MAEEHPARAAALRSIQFVHEKKREAWLDNFAEDACIEDPIGKSPLDPTGHGHRGRQAIAAFWDRHIAPNGIIFNIVASYACGDECANVGSLTNVLPNGALATVNGVFTYRVNAAGKVTNLRAYWELARMKVVPRA